MGTLGNLHMSDRPTFFVLVGFPGVGKSTWLSKQDTKDAVVTGSDRHIEAFAEKQGKTYTEVFISYVKRATSAMKADIRSAVKNQQTIYLDMTNLTKGSRAARLQMVPDSYRKVAVVFTPPNTGEWARRLQNRPGKQIPEDVLVQMIKSYQKPTPDEGFDEIINV
jgi:tRNA uridine 5-carbamoylmethylation protein Kti12